MGFFKKSRSQSFDLYSTHAYYVPGVGDMFLLLAMLLLGSLLGALVVATLSICGLPLGQDLRLLISYPLMFIPPMMLASYKGRRNVMFERGFALDSDHFGPKGCFVASVVVVIAMLSCQFVLDPVNRVLPEMPQWLKDTLESMTAGNVWINLICVSIFAPIFEEWLCRGMVLRGLLNAKRADGTPLMAPAAAIVVSALFFAVIHFNLWQAVTAFTIGLLMGFVYYKTGSLKLTMLMHFTNNTLAIVLSNIDSLKDIESFYEVMTPWVYALVCLMNIVILAGAVWYFSRIEPQRPEGSCDIIEEAAQ